MKTYDKARRDQLEDQFTSLADERWFEGVVRILERRFPNRSEWAEDAVGTAFERVVQGDRVFPSVVELKKWLFVVALNDMRRRAKREAGRPLPPWELERSDSRSAEEEALERVNADDLHAELRDLVEKWPSARRRVVGLFVLEAERLGEPSSGADIVAHVADVLGVDISLTAAWRLKRVVLRRLMSEVEGDPNPVEEIEGDEDDE